MSLKKLNQLNLSRNRLTGEIPAALNDTIINVLDLSNNLLSGRIPPELGNMKLDVFNVSNNDLSGRDPEALDIAAYKEGFLGNPKLCGGQNLMLPPCHSPHNLSRRRLATILVPLLLVVAVLFCSICLCYSFFRKASSGSTWKLTPFHSTEVDMIYILKNWMKSVVIGSGSAGKVYKVILKKGEAVAVKQIRNTSRLQGRFNRKDEQEENIDGDVEVDTLGLIRHTNIIKLLSCMTSEESDYKLLVYEYMPNGSLFFDRLHGSRGPETLLPWPTRYKIAVGAARGLSYMHHDCTPPILHRDVKSSNILLDGEFAAKIADFGVSKVVDRLEDENRVSSYVGSHGYIAPEYLDRLRVDEKSDVYSFGVVVLELVSRRKATGEADYGEGVDIVGWIRNTISMRGEREAMDARVVEKKCKEQMMRVLRVGLLCTNREPNQRPCMRQVVEMLVACGVENHKERGDGKPFQHFESISGSQSESENRMVNFSRLMDLQK